MLPSLLEPEQLNACGRGGGLVSCKAEKKSHSCGRGGGFVSCKAEKSLIPAAVLLPSPSLLEPDQLNACGGGGFCRRWLEPDQLNACGRLLPSPSLMEPDQLNACGGGGFCRRWLEPDQLNACNIPILRKALKLKRPN